MARTKTFALFLCGCKEEINHFMDRLNAEHPHQILQSSQERGCYSFQIDLENATDVEKLEHFFYNHLGNSVGVKDNIWNVQGGLCECA